MTKNEKRAIEEIVKEMKSSSCMINAVPRRQFWGDVNLVDPNDHERVYVYDLDGRSGMPRQLEDGVNVNGDAIYDEIITPVTKKHKVELGSDGFHEELDSAMKKDNIHICVLRNGDALDIH